MSKYICSQCKKEVPVVRFNLDSKDKRQLCDKCYWAKDKDKTLDKK